VGGAVVDGISWHWIFWINVPVGLIVIPLALAKLRESRGVSRRLDPPGVVLASGGLLGVVYALVQAPGHGWTSPLVLATLIAGLAMLAGFVIWEQRSPQPMLPMRFFRSRAFSATNVVSLAMYFGMFGSIFLLAQFFQTAQHYTPLEAGLRTLPWTAMPIFVAPIAGILSDKVGSRPLMFTGLSLQRRRWSGSRPSSTRPCPTTRSWCRSSWPAPGWRWCSRRPPTRSCRRCPRRPPARPRAPPTRSAK
jgi:MFS family permease